MREIDTNTMAQLSQSLLLLIFRNCPSRVYLAWRARQQCHQPGDLTTSLARSFCVACNLSSSCTRHQMCMRAHLHLLWPDEQQREGEEARLLAQTDLVWLAVRHLVCMMALTICCNQQDPDSSSICRNVLKSDSNVSGLTRSCWCQSMC